MRTYLFKCITVALIFLLAAPQARAQIIYSNSFPTEASVSGWDMSGVTWDSNYSGSLVFAAQGSSVTVQISSTGTQSASISVSARWADYLYLETSPDGVNYTDQGKFTGVSYTTRTMKTLPDGTRYVKFVGHSDVYLVSFAVAQASQNCMQPEAFDAVGTLAWILCDDGTLTITGEGAIPSFMLYDSPFYELRASIRTAFIGDEVTAIGRNAFAYCSQMTSVSIGSGVTVIDYQAFVQSGLTSVTIPEGVIEIGDGAFGNCANLATVYFNAVDCANLSGTLSHSFANCPLLTTVVFGNNVERIPGYVMYNVGSLRNVTIGSGAKAIGRNAFNYSGLTSIVIPDNVTSIEYHAFNSAANLASVTFGKGLTEIGQAAFQSSGLESLVIPEWMTKFEPYVFNNCAKLETVYFDAVNLEDFAGSSSPFSGSTSLTSVEFGNKVERIPSSVFNGISSLTDVTIGSSVSSIGREAFRYSGVTSVVIPGNVKTIEQNAFSGSSLVSVVMQEGVETIGQSAFAGCTSLTTIEIPASLATITVYAFQGCTALSEITNHRATPQTLDGWMFTNVPKTTCVLRVPEGSLDAYSTATEWRDFTNIEEIISGGGCTIIASGTTGDNLVWTLCEDGTLTISGTGAMPDYEWEEEQPWYVHQNDINNVIIDNGVSNIGAAAFQGLRNMTSAIIPNTVTKIGSHSFNQCGIMTIDIPASVIDIDVYAIYMNDDLTAINVDAANPVYASIDGLLLSKDEKTLLRYPGGKPDSSYDIPGSVTHIGDGAFYDCQNLTSMVIPATVTHIGSQAFRYSNYIASVTLLDGLINIGYGAFDYCYSLTEIFIPASVTEIGSNAFGGSNALTKIEVDANNANYVSVDGVLFNKGITTLMQFPAGSAITVYEIPASVTTIDAMAFSHAEKITSVTIGSLVTTIESGAFRQCNNLIEIISHATTPPTLGWDAIGVNNKSAITVRVPAPSLQTYRNAAGWSEFANIVEMSGGGCDPGMIACGTTGPLTWTLTATGVLTISGTGEMPDYPLNGTPWNDYIDDIVNVDIDYGVINIGQYAFANCLNLESVTIANSVEIIGMAAFMGCHNLTSINIPGSVNSIGDSAFWTTGLSSIDIPASVTNIDSGAFGYCNNLLTINVDPNNTAYVSDDGILFTVDQKILVQYPAGKIAVSYDIPSLVNVINRYAFAGCSNLTSINFPNALSTIESLAFFYCRGLTSINIPASVNNIESSAFLGCENLTEIINNATTPQTIDEYVFYEVDITNITLYVPFCSIDDYSNAAVWEDFDNIVAIAGSTVDCGACDPGMIACGATGPLTWTLSESGTLTISGDGNMPNYNDSDNYPPWYEHKKSVTGVVIEHGVTSIGNFAFFYHEDLETVTLGSTIENIGSFSFYKSSLAQIVLPSSLKSIGDFAFSGNNFTTVTIPVSVETIGEGPFGECELLTEIIVENGSTHFMSEGGVLFNSGKTWLIQYPSGKSDADYEISSGIKIIGRYAFYENKNLVTLTIPQTVETIHYAAFANCENLVEVTVFWDTPPAIASNYIVFLNIASSAVLKVPAGRASVYEAVETWSDFNIEEMASGGSPFVIVDNVLVSYTCTSGAAEIPTGVTAIGNEAFMGCAAMTSVVIPNTVLSIGDRAFAGCSGLTAINIPASVKEIGLMAFANCTSNQAFTVDSESEDFASVDGVLYNKDITLLIAYPLGKPATTFKVPASVASISPGAFDGNKSLQTIDVSEMGSGGGSGSSGSIGDYAFAGVCQTAFVIPETVTAIGKYAFYNATCLTSVTMPASLNAIGESAFSGCTTLATITIYNPVPPDLTASPNVFAGVDKSANTTLYVPAGSLAAYRAADQWEEFENIVEMSGSGCAPGLIACGTAGPLTWTVSEGGTLTISGQGAMPDYDWNGQPWLPYQNIITDVVIEPGITVIGNNAFQFYQNITSVSIPNTVKTIVGNAFYWCSGLLAIDIPNSVETIGGHAFAGCSNLTTVFIPNSVTSVETMAFSGCTKLMEILVDNTHPFFSSEKGVLYNKDKTLLMQYPAGKTDAAFVIPVSVKTVRYGVFWGAENLKSVTIPNSVTTLDAHSFYGSELDEIINLAVVPQDIVEDVFYYENLSAITLRVLAGSLEAYKTANVWKNFVNIEAIATNCAPCDVQIACNTTGSLTWTLCANGTLTISGVGAMPDYSSTSVPWYEHRSSITNVIIDDGVSSIGINAFYGLHQMNSIEIPNTVTKIGYQAFTQNGLSSIVIPSSVIEISDYAFYFNDNLIDIDVESGSLAFASIDGVLFSADKKTLVVYPGGRTVTDYLVPAGTTHIGVGAFYSSRIKSIVFPPSLTHIGESAFRYSRITALIFHDGLIYIGGSAFENNDDLAEIYISASVSEIGNGAFAGNGKLSKIDVADGNNQFSSIDGVLFDKDVKTLVQYPAGNLTQTYAIPASVTTIMGWAFQHSFNLTSVTIGSSVSAIGYGAFWDCTGLEEIINYATTPQPHDTYNTFMNVDRTLLLYVPAPSIAAYRAATGWREFENIEAIPGTELPEPSVVAVTGVTLDRSTLTLLVGAIANLQATVAPENAANKSVVWTSSNNIVATVDSTGRVTGVSAGTAIITVTTVDGERTAECTVTVNAPPVAVTGITLNKSATMIAVDISEQLTATVAPDSAANKSIRWTSSVPAVATVDNTGKVTGVSAGETVITATTVDGNRTATCAVTVTEPLVIGVGVGVVEGTVTEVAVSVSVQGITVYLYIHISFLKSDGLEDYVLVGVTETDASGRYSFAGLPEGSYRVVVDMGDYQSAPSQAVNITGNTTGGTVNFSVDSDNKTVTPGNPSLVITSASELIASELLVYPNPFTGSVRIVSARAVETRHATSLQMQVFNAAGAIVHTQMITGDDETVNLEHLPAGVYIFRFVSDEQTQTVRAVKN